jgi:hypothetical protein
LALSGLVNGYIGSLGIPFPRRAGQEDACRARLLELLASNRIVATLGASMMFARDPSNEYLRLNYFLNPEALEGSVRRILSFVGSY